MTTLVVVLLLLSVSLGATGQILYKKGMTGKLKKFRVKELIKLLFTRNIIIGLMLYFGSAVIYLYVLSKAELSFAYPFFASGYALVAFLSWRFLKEKISRTRLIGIGVIIMGVVLVGLS